MNDNKTNIFRAFFVFFSIIIAGCSHSTLPRPEHLVFPPLRYDTRVPVRYILENGLTVFLLEDHELPIIEVTVQIRAGSVYDPPEKAGLASLTGTVMRTGGTRHVTPEEFDASIDKLGAHISVSVNAEETTASLWTLSEDFDRAFHLFSEMLMEPAFDPSKFSLARENFCQSLRRLPDNPQQFAMREFKKVFYRNNPRGYAPSLDSVRRITRDDLKNFHWTFFQPQNTYLGICGDFSTEQMKTKIKEQFSHWHGNLASHPFIPPPRSLERIEIYVQKKQLPQTTIISGFLAPAKNDTDFFAFQVLDHIIGSGGFSSRLMSQVRSNQGLAYSVGSFYRASTDYGIFGMYCLTKSSTTYVALESMRTIIQSIINIPPSEAELIQAKNALINSFIFSYETPQQILMQHIMIEFEHLPHDFYATYPQRIQSVTTDDIIRVAKRWLGSNASTVYMLGDPFSFDVVPSSLASVPRIEVSSDLLMD